MSDATVPTVRVSGCGVVRILSCILFLTDTGLGLRQLATQLFPRKGACHLTWFLIGLLGFEFWFPLYLLPGTPTRLAWYTTVLCFGVFACVSAYTGFLGEGGFGCFGTVVVNSRYTAATDVALVSMSLSCRPGEATPDSKRAWRLCFESLRTGILQGLN